MPHEDYVPAEPGPDYTFDPATLYQSLPRPAYATPPTPPPELSPRVAKVGVALVLLGAGLLLLGRHRVARAEATRGWIETTAVISGAKLVAQGQEYRLELAYRYRTGPRERPGGRIALEPDLSREVVYAQASRFRPGARVPAWFDPAAPDSVVLLRPEVAAPRAPGLVGALLLVIGLSPFLRQLSRHLRHRIASRRFATA